jgi:multiple sugar transport system permease protein
MVEVDQEPSTGLTRPDSAASPPKRRRRRWKAVIPYLCLSPAALGIIVFVAWPIITVFQYSLQDYNPTQPWNNKFVGLSNFVEAFTSDPIFFGSLWVSLKWVIVQVVAQLILGMALALLLNRTFRGRGVFRAFTFAPWAVAGVVVTATWTLMYQPVSGMVNTALTTWGIIDEPIFWLANPDLTFWSVSLAELWRGIPFFTIMLLAGLQSIPNELYESASIDGAGRAQTFRLITLPMLKDTIVLSTLLRAVWEFNNVDVIYTMTGGGPGGRTTTLPVYVVNQAVHFQNFGYGSALSVISFALLLAFALIYLKVSNFGRGE